MKLKRLLRYVSLFLVTVPLMSLSIMPMVEARKTAGVTGAKSKNLQKQSNIPEKSKPLPTAKRNPALPLSSVMAGQSMFVDIAAAKLSAQQAQQPVGNNGTVKIDGIPFDEHPNNQPHPGCTFQVDFYNFDKGNFNAEVTFEAQAPSGKGVLLTSTVFVGGDAAGGGKDVDAQRTYDLSGKLKNLKRQKNQGYHVKLTVELPNVPGVGKHKVFWVDCGEATPPPPPPPVRPTDNDGGRGGGASVPVSPRGGQVLGTTTNSPGVAALPYTGVVNDWEPIITLVGIMLYLAVSVWASRRLNWSQIGNINYEFKPFGLSAIMPNYRKVTATAAIALTLALTPFLQTGLYGMSKVSAQPVTEVPQSAEAEESKQLRGKPVRIVIPHLGIDLTLANGTYNKSTKSWSVADNRANYATNSVLPNNVSGMTLIYGHNTGKVFRLLSRLNQNDTVRIYTDNNHVFTYKYSDYAVVAPTDTGVFNQLKGDPGLKLITCDGNKAQNRRIVSLTLVSAR